MFDVRVYFLQTILGAKACFYIEQHNARAELMFLMMISFRSHDIAQTGTKTLHSTR